MRRLPLDQTEESSILSFRTFSLSHFHTCQFSSSASNSSDTVPSQGVMALLSRIRTVRVSRHVGSLHAGEEGSEIRLVDIAVRIEVRSRAPGRALNHAVAADARLKPPEVRLIHI